MREGKRLLGRHTLILQDNIKMDIEEIVYEDVDFSRLNQNRAQWLALACTLVSL